MLEWNNIHFAYSKKSIFEDVSLCFSEKKNHCLIGRNGSGKSTFLKISANILKPSHGRIHRSIKNFSFVPAHNELHPCLKVLDLVDMFLKHPSGFHKSFAYQALEIDKIPSEKYLSHISSGQRQRLLLALSLVKHAEIRFFDEPLNHLDPYYQNTFFEVLNETDSLNFLVSHQLESALHLKNANILLADESKVLDLGPPEKALESKELEKTFHIKAKITDNPINGNKVLAISKYESK